ncbi:MAG: hypothetical protein IM561_08970 [Microcystis sp. M60BS1]|uniref:hypothetical protein n=1 Tax=unclassified Microcystis TaxID=2643300 RepID=UPI00257F962D|nr:MULTISPECIES: hypothetical protein [unclassified Microcystis]MCA6581499.1 hypothetical protein [Pseudanabaena sp. M34BS1SP1A06MG]MCA2510500.1 hypothetical protein [Microcystis sp. M60BS1]MCA2555786.1 hypothetical protein [Microcystis sp. M43BS1]MCA2603438.1 hypothetical protein [Microcystis sp. M26BS1]MCA2638432.1 hypothetical protein [Microcystis sp. M18BS1]
MVVNLRETYDDFWLDSAFRRTTPTKAVAAGSQAVGPAKAASLLDIPNISDFDQIYSSDFSSPVSLYDDPYDRPTSVKSDSSQYGPLNSQEPVVSTQPATTSKSNQSPQMISGIDKAEIDWFPDPKEANSSPTVTTATTGSVSTPVTNNSGPNTGTVSNPKVADTVSNPTTTQPSTPTNSTKFSGDPTSLAALTNSPTIDDYIKNILGGTPSGRLTSNGFDLTQLMRDRPDVYRAFFTEYNNPRSNDKNSTAWINRVGGNDPYSYANYWYNTYGRNEGYNQTPTTTTPTTPTTTGGTSTTPGTGSETPPGTNTNPNPGTGQGTGTVGANGPTNQSRLEALNQALARAKVAVAGRGLNWDNYKDLFVPLYTDIYNTIPDTSTTATAYFDPNMANTILSGEENRQRFGYRQKALRIPTNFDNSFLNDTIAKIMGGATQQGSDMLTNGLKRGQFNEVGVKGGQDALSKAAMIARAKLLGYSSQLGSKYNTQLENIQKSALQAASGWQLGDSFDISPYEQQQQRLFNQAQQASEGELYSLMGDQPLINLSDIRMGAGTAQGALNLTDLDVLDAIAKRKSVNDLGRGLGSQGSF